MTNRDGGWGQTTSSVRAHCCLTSVLVDGWGCTAGWGRTRIYRLARVLIKLAQVWIKGGGRGRGRDAFCDRILEWVLEY